ncbi:MAG: hypothetical protein HY547_03040 [Elusimicrobia bacterium]|nr:hypothetical protein [Elusimicrobiota bacterium]
MEVLRKFFLAAILFWPNLIQGQTNEFLISAGAANYQFEGAGPGSNIWESKPTYMNQPYIEAEYRRSLPTGRSFASKYNRWKLSYLGGKPVLENDQAIERKVESLVLRVGWSWMFPKGVGFEVGPLALGQWQEVTDAAHAETQHYQSLRLGSYFAGKFERQRGPWRFDATASIGAAGMPQRQSAVSEWVFSGKRHFRRWWAGLKVFTSLIQIERKDNFVRDVGTVNNAIVMFRQGETDFEGLALEAGFPLD